MAHHPYDPSKSRAKNRFIPEKTTCPGCGGQISVHMLNRHKGTKSCQSMAKWRKANPDKIRALQASI